MPAPKSAKKKSPPGKPDRAAAKSEQARVDSEPVPARDDLATLNSMPVPAEGDRVNAQAAPVTGDRVSIIATLWRTAEKQVRDIEARLDREDQPPAERERDSRMMAILVKTLREMIALDGTPGDDAAASQTEAEDADPVPRDIDEFRRELARRIRAFVAAKRDGDAGVPGDDQ